MPTKIFYVEDEVFLAKIIKESLETKGYEVCLVSDGAKALTEFETFCPDICVLDVMLPNKSGFEIGREIRELSPNIPIIFLTAKNQTHDVVEGFEVGGNDYIRKPCSLEELILRIENLLKLTKQTVPIETTLSDHITIGQFSFLPTKYQLIHKQNNPINLSHKEAELLKLLCANIHQELARKEILQTLWGDDSIFNSRTLDVYITKLRGYLKPDPNIKIITLRGVGYYFRVDQ